MIKTHTISFSKTIFCTCCCKCFQKAKRILFFNLPEDDNDFPQQIEDINESPQLLIDRLRNELKKSYAEIVRLKAKISDDKSDNNDGNDFYNQRNELLKMLSHKNSTIQRMSSDILILQTQLKEAVTAKFDALVRLDAVDGKELTLQFKEKQMEMNNENLQHLKHNLEMTDASLDQQVDMENYRKLQNVDNEIPTMSPPTPPTTNVDMGPTSSKCIDLLNDESDTALELLKQVRTRRQTHFVLQALNG